MQHHVTVITADVVNSRQHPEEIGKLARELEQLQDADLLAGFSLLKGDEIQGLCKGYLAAPGLIRQLRYYCRPLKIRIGIGLGKLGADEVRANPWEMNGPVFHLAREALIEVKEDNSEMTAIRTGCSKYDQIINTIFSLIDTIQGRWTDAQWEAIHLYETEGTYREAAEILEIALQNVAKRCKAASWHQVKEAEATLKAIGGWLQEDELASKEGR